MSSLSRLWDAIQPHQSSIIRASVFSILNKVADLAPPLLIGMAVDIVVKKEDSLLAQWGVVDPLIQLVVLAGLTVLVWGAESIFEFLLAMSWRNLAQRLQHEFRINTYAHIQKLDLRWYTQQRSGRLMSILNDDVNQLERFLNGGANALLQVGTTALSVSAVFFYLSPTVAMLSILPIPAIIWGSFVFQRRIAPKYTAVREAAGNISAQLANNLSGMETIKSFTAEQWANNQIEDLSLEYESTNQEAIKLSSLFSPLIRMVIVIGFTATLIYGGMLALDGTLEVGAYSVLVFLTQRLLWPLTRLGETVDLYQRAMASAERILNLLDEKPPHQEGGEAIDLHQAKELRYSKVNFAYSGREFLFKDFSFQAQLGQTIAIVGPTGSGKSTLLRLLLRFYQPQSGTIKIDSRTIDSLSLSSLRHQIGLVSQSVYLFDGSIEDNIALGDPSSSKSAIREAAQIAEIDEFIVGLPDGYATRVGERGQRLSGGQRQRISIARAVLKDPPILILDEATSAVDNETEAAIQRSLAKIAVGRTVFVVAHRLSTIRNADRIIVLEQGEIVGDGAHDELIEQSGLYKRLWSVQTGNI